MVVYQKRVHLHYMQYKWHLLSLFKTITYDSFRS
ncbi:hypothetical protein EZS27_023749 [termite gut metagenome]|uniref:Uncharacterized protein n=1 Tax=termite gut metagenome TaxID=433724 RepID=A0A5J4R1Y5_9ZZZZ